MMGALARTRQGFLESIYKREHPTRDCCMHPDYCQDLHNLLSLDYAEVTVLTMKGKSEVSAQRELKFARALILLLCMQLMTMT